jgi:hypothetical protein
MSPDRYSGRPFVSIAERYLSTTVRQQGGRRTVTLSSHSVLRWGSAVGTRVHRSFSGPAVVGCTGGQVHLNGGPLVGLFPLGATFLVPLGAAILVVVGWRDRVLPHRRVRADPRRSVP